ncbi:MAG: hypothetical protein ABIU09_01295 [Pyrinomonadaceae bacterium]
MQILRREQKNYWDPYFNRVYCDILNSELSVPDFAFPWNPVTLTIKVRFSLNFADSQQGTLRPGVIHEEVTGEYAGFYAKDSNGDLFRIRDWDFGTQLAFAHAFKQGERFWDRKFMLITPDSYAGFDYQLPDDVKNGTSWRPNVLCRFELVSVPGQDVLSHDLFPGDKVGDPAVHLRLDVVRSQQEKYGNVRGQFRYHSKLYDVRTVNSRGLWHELGHAIDEDHIQGLLGNQACTIGDPRNGDDHCYVTPEGVESNIMGSGTGLLLLNAKPWVELIQHHTNTWHENWEVSRNTVMPPRKIPGVMPKKPLGSAPEQPRRPISVPGFSDFDGKPLPK